MLTQADGVIALTRCANRKAGYAACFFLLIMGICQYLESFIPFVYRTLSMSGGEKKETNALQTYLAD